MTPHQLRHAFGSNLADAGGGLDEVAELLGHASMSSSQVYLHPDPARLRDGRRAGAQPSRADRELPGERGRGAAPRRGPVTAASMSSPAGHRTWPAGRGDRCGDRPGVPGRGGLGPGARWCCARQPSIRCWAGRSAGRRAATTAQQRADLRLVPARLTALRSERSAGRRCCRPGLRRAGTGLPVTAAHGAVSAPAALCRLIWTSGASVGQDCGSPRPACPLLLRPCAVAACTRRRRHPDGTYCDRSPDAAAAPHRRADPGLDEQHWRRTEPAIGCGGQVSFRGLPPLVVAQVLFGLQQRCRIDAVKTNEADLRALCDDLRRQQVTTIGDYDLPDDRNLALQGPGQRPDRARPPGAGHPGDRGRQGRVGPGGVRAQRHVDFTGISQTWLREAAKRWAADDLPRRRVRPDRRTSGG